MPTTNLAARHILVTRPEHQAEPLCRLIEAAGGTPIRLPALVIHDNGDDPDCVHRLAHLDDYQVVIFISPNAVNFGLDAIDRHGGLLNGPIIACVGKGSARALEQRLGRRPDLLPEGRYDSEALLQLEPLKHVSGKQILIVRGVGGRELLADTLRQRGARVEYAEVYRRASPPPPADFEWLQRAEIITASSGETLQNLVNMTPPPLRDKLYRKPLLVVSRRCAEMATQLGFGQTPRVSAVASDESMLESLIEWAQGPQQNGKQE